MAFRILTSVNYSAGENPEGDSGLVFTTKLITTLVANDPEMHFYVLVPQTHVQIWSAALIHPRVTPIPIPMLPRLHGGDFHFDPAELYRRFDFRRYDVDVLFLNQPELVPAFLQFFNRQTFHNVPAVSYVHWFDTRRPSTPKQVHHRPALLAALSGMCMSATVGCNSVYGRERILAQASEWFNAESLAQLARRLVVLPPGVDVPELLKARRPRSAGPLRLLINHRLLKYTGVRGLIADALPQLWTERQDFEVHATNPSQVRLPGTLTQVRWLRVETLTRQRYLETLWNSDIVVAPHRATHWSMSTIEAICAERVVLMNKESFFHEMMRPLLAGLAAEKRRHIEERWFYFRGNLVARLSQLLDNIDEERQLGRDLGQRARQIYDWRCWNSRWCELLYAADSLTPKMSERNPSMQKILRMLQREGPLPKEEILRRLRWAPKQRTLAWTSFRKQLRDVAPDDSSQPNVVFKLPNSHPARPRDVAGKNFCEPPISAASRLE
jgi:hypothetical protein